MDATDEGQLVAGDEDGRAAPARLLLLLHDDHLRGQATPTEAALAHQDQGARIDAPHARPAPGRLHGPPHRQVAYGCRPPPAERARSSVSTGSARLPIHELT